MKKAKITSLFNGQEYIIEYYICVMNGTSGGYYVSFLNKDNESIATVGMTNSMVLFDIEKNLQLMNMR